MSKRPDWLPLDENVDLSELAELDAALEATVRKLEATIGCHIAVYQAGVRPRGRELRDAFETAVLTTEQAATLGEAEQSCPGRYLVAYAKPLVRRGARP